MFPILDPQALAVTAPASQSAQHLAQRRAELADLETARRTAGLDLVLLPRTFPDTSPVGAASRPLRPSDYGRVGVLVVYAAAPPDPTLRLQSPALTAAYHEQQMAMSERVLVTCPIERTHTDIGRESRNPIRTFIPSATKHDVTIYFHHPDRTAYVRSDSRAAITLNGAPVRPADHLSLGHPLKDGDRIGTSQLSMGWHYHPQKDQLTREMLDMKPGTRVVRVTVLRAKEVQAAAEKIAAKKKKSALAGLNMLVKAIEFLSLSPSPFRRAEQPVPTSEPSTPTSEPSTPATPASESSTTTAVADFDPDVSSSTVDSSMVADISDASLISNVVVLDDLIIAKESIKLPEQSKGYTNTHADEDHSRARTAKRVAKQLAPEGAPPRSAARAAEIELAVNPLAALPLPAPKPELLKAWLMEQGLGCLELSEEQLLAGLQAAIKEDHIDAVKKTLPPKIFDQPVWAPPLRAFTVRKAEAWVSGTKPGMSPPFIKSGKTELTWSIPHGADRLMELYQGWFKNNAPENADNIAQQPGEAAKLDNMWIAFIYEGLQSADPSTRDTVKGMVRQYLEAEKEEKEELMAGEEKEELMAGEEKEELMAGEEMDLSFDLSAELRAFDEDSLTVVPTPAVQTIPALDVVEPLTHTLDIGDGWNRPSMFPISDERTVIQPCPRPVPAPRLVVALPAPAVQQALPHAEERVEWRDSISSVPEPEEPMSPEPAAVFENEVVDFDHLLSDLPPTSNLSFDVLTDAAYLNSVAEWDEELSLAGFGRVNKDAIYEQPRGAGAEYEVAGANVVIPQIVVTDAESFETPGVDPEIDFPITLLDTLESVAAPSPAMVDLTAAESAEIAENEVYGPASPTAAAPEPSSVQLVGGTDDHHVDEPETTPVVIVGMGRTDDDPTNNVVEHDTLPTIEEEVVPSTSVQNDLEPEPATIALSAPQETLFNPFSNSAEPVTEPATVVEPIAGAVLAKKANPEPRRKRLLTELGVSPRKAPAKKARTNSGRKAAEKLFPTAKEGEHTTEPEKPEGNAVAMDEERATKPLRGTRKASAKVAERRVVSDPAPIRRSARLAGRSTSSTVPSAVAEADVFSVPTHPSSTGAEATKNPASTEPAVMTAPPVVIESPELSEQEKAAKTRPIRSLRKTSAFKAIDASTASPATLGPITAASTTRGSKAVVKVPVVEAVEKVVPAVVAKTTRKRIRATDDEPEQATVEEIKHPEPAAKRKRTRSAAALGERSLNIQQAKRARKATVPTVTGETEPVPAKKTRTVKPNVTLPDNAQSFEAFKVVKPAANTRKAPAASKVDKENAPVLPARRQTRSMSRAGLAV